MDFINRLVNKHIQPERNILPRAKARFETDIHNNSHKGFNEVKSEEDTSDEAINPTESNLDTSPVKPPASTVSFIDIKSKAQKNIDYTKEPILFPKKEKQPVENIINHINYQDSKTREIKEQKDNGSELAMKKIRTNPELLSTDSRYVDSEESVIHHFGNDLPLVTPSVKNRKEFTSESKYQDYSWLKDKKEVVEKNKLPTIKITIGRINVQANIQKRSSEPKKRKVRKPNLSLEDYLNKRK